MSRFRSFTWGKADSNPEPSPKPENIDFIALAIIGQLGPKDLEAFRLYIQVVSTTPNMSIAGIKNSCRFYEFGATIRSELNTRWPTDNPLASEEAKAFILRLAKRVEHWLAQ